MDEGSYGPSYRRGLVLGLTLAEVFLLLLFLLLAVFAYLLSVEEKKTEYVRQALTEADLPFTNPGEFEGSVDDLSAAYKSQEIVKKISNDPDEFIATVNALGELKSILGDLGVEIDDPNALRTRLVQMRDEELLAEKYKDVCGNLEELENKLKNFHGEDKTAEDILDSCPATVDNSGLDADDLPTSLEDAIPVVKRQKSQIDNLTKRLDDALGGRGLVYPPCWVRNGKTVYSYNVSIQDDGLVVSKGDDRSGMDLSALRKNGVEPELGSVVSDAEFNRRTKGMFDWSVENQCRFFVRISDESSLTNKQGYKEHLAGIENHFYKLLLD